LDIAVAEFTETLDEFSLPVDHRQDTDAIFRSDTIVICTKSRGGMDNACTVFRGDEVTEQYTEGISTGRRRCIGFVRQKLFITKTFQVRPLELAEDLPGQDLCFGREAGKITVFAFGLEVFGE